MNENGGKKDTSWFSVLLFAVLIVIGYWGWHHYQKTPEPQPEASERTISAAPLAEREVTVDKGYIGYVTPINDVSVRPYISGFIDDIRVKGGSEVKSGDVLLVINQAEDKAQLDAASASVAQA